MIFFYVKKRGKVNHENQIYATFALKKLRQSRISKHKCLIFKPLQRCQKSIA